VLQAGAYEMFTFFLTAATAETVIIILCTPIIITIIFIIIIIIISPPTIIIILCSAPRHVTTGLRVAGKTSGTRMGPRLFRQPTNTTGGVGGRNVNTTTAAER
jgi:hypothetical protein